MVSDNIIWHNHYVKKEDRADAYRVKPCVLWFTGLSSSGKSTIAGHVEKILFERGLPCYLLDGDNIRHGLNKDLGFSSEDRSENIRRISEVSALFVDAGFIVISAFISPFSSDRMNVRNRFQHNEFIEVYIDAPFDLCVQRDPKGLYKKALQGKVDMFTGISSPYEPPVNPELHIKTDEISITECVNHVLRYLETYQYIPESSRYFRGL